MLCRICPSGLSLVPAHFETDVSTPPPAHRSSCRLPSLPLGSPHSSPHSRRRRTTGTTNPSSTTLSLLTLATPPSLPPSTSLAMSTLNIGGDKSDASYRYKMPALITKIEGRGNGIKTVILNMAELAKSLHIHPAYPTKFFGIELGAQSKYSAASDRAVVNGAHQPGDLAKILERFIQQFILCPRCKLPELKMSVKSSIKIDCAACGHNTTIKTTHKLAQYMIKNPPSALAAEEEAKAKKGKKVKAGDLEVEVPEAIAVAVEKEKEGKKKGGKRVHKKSLKKKDGAEDGGDADENGAEDEEEDEEELEEVEEVKEKKPKKKERVVEAEPTEAAAPREKKDKKPSDEDVWYTDTSKEAQQARKEAEFKEQRDAASASIEAILASTKLDSSKAETPVTTLKIFLANGKRRTEEIAAEVKRITLAKGLDLSAKLRLVLEAVVETEGAKDGKGVANTLHKYRALLAGYTGERASDVAMLCAVEELLGASHREWISGVPWVLKQLDEDEVVHEDSIIGWYDSPPESSWLVKKEVAVEVRQRAKVYVEHLKTLESEGDEEDGDEEEEEDDEEDEA